MEVDLKEFLRALIGNDTTSEPIQDTSSEDTPSDDVTSGGNEPTGEDDKINYHEEFRSIVREELKGMLEEYSKLEQQIQKDARAATVQTVPEKEPERSVEDIMATRYKSALGVKEKKGD